MDEARQRQALREAQAQQAYFMCKDKPLEDRQFVEQLWAKELMAIRVKGGLPRRLDNQE